MFEPIVSSPIFAGSSRDAIRPMLQSLHAHSSVTQWLGSDGEVARWNFEDPIFSLKINPNPHGNSLDDRLVMHPSRCHR